jgi:hypothetical protein
MAATGFFVNDKTASMRGRTARGDLTAPPFL